ncbi:MAG TPA: UDP-3-O-acyl-N-acetylglucosamine deacetylase [Thermoanaerobaculia bacterium]|nr:UDP-3-O-acyl-N-acetylglucosamine deacetylase [Thermoanaerobaculia bacterium]
METLARRARLGTPSPLFAQKTIARPVAISGVGIHTGKSIRIKLVPAPDDTGVVFRRTDSGGIEIPALTSEVSSVELATSLGRDDVTISTVEHLLAAVRVCDVDNLWIDIDGPEVPILDGSALPFLHLLEAAGIRWQRSPRRILAITAPLTVELGGRSISVSPYPGLRVSYAIDFAHPAIGHQETDLVVSREAFERELAPARTFALMSDVERLHRRGLGLGGDADNCVIFGLDGPTNTALRFADEPVRHKALDVIGDLALAGGPLWAHVEVERGGHQVHFSLLEALRQRPDCWTWMEWQPRLQELPVPAGTDLEEAAEILGVEREAPALGRRAAGRRAGG